MKIEVYPLKKMYRLIEDGKVDNLISIRDQVIFGDSEGKMYGGIDRRCKEMGVNVLPLVFDDIDPYRFQWGLESPMVTKKFEDGIHKPIFFDATMAKQVMEFVLPLWEQNHDMKLTIHCWAGRSRSQALAYWLNMKFNLMLERNIGDYTLNNATNIHENVHFNCEVLRVMTSVFG